MDASHPARPMGRIMTALCAAIVLFAGAINAAGAQTLPADPAAAAPVTAAATTVAADAQPAPAASSPPAGQTRPSGQNNPAPPNSGGTGQTPVRPLPPLSHLPIIDFVVTFTQPAYYTNMSQLPAYDPIDLGGTVRIPITRKLNLFFDRITEGTLNQPLERSYVAIPGTVPGTPCTVAVCVPVLSKDTRDVILQYHATYAFNRFISMDIGDSFRHRIFASGAGTPPLQGFPLRTNISAQPFPYTLSSTEHHFGYLGFSYTTKPVKELLRSTFVFSETLDRQNVDHNVAILCNAAMVAGNINRCGGLLPNQVGYLDENPRQNTYYETTQGISMIVPVDPKHGTSFLLNERWGYLNFYENAVTPYRWDSALTYQLSKRFSPGFTLALRHSDFHASATQSAPFTSPNAIHVGSWDIIGTFHLDLNSVFH